MEHIHSIESQVLQYDNMKEMTILLRDLYKEVTDFVSRLDVHSRKEEEVLFPLMAEHIGRQAGPIAVMEYEHDMAKNYLRQFLQFEITNEKQETADMISYASQALCILKEHFMKEETVLFPLAEQILTVEEKVSLLRGIEEIR